MLVTAWSNGAPRQSGAGYGIRVEASDRERYFARSWPEIDVDLGAYGRATISVSASFWSRCPELRSAMIGRWLLGHRVAPWPAGRPPQLTLLPQGGTSFRLTGPV
jgi:hypothetical protein